MKYSIVTADRAVNKICHTESSVKLPVIRVILDIRLSVHPGHPGHLGYLGHLGHLASFSTLQTN